MARWGISEVGRWLDPRPDIDERKAHMLHRPGRHHMPPTMRMMKPFFLLFVLVETVFCALVATCFLYALHRIATALRTEARIRALEKMPEAFTEEEREVLVHKIKTRTLGSF